MSLDFYVSVPENIYYTRSEGSTVAVPMEDCQYEELHVGNITHNLNKMAMHVPVKTGRGENNRSLYDVLWRPDENSLELTDDVLPLVDAGIRYMLEHTEELKAFNPDNGWGTYEGLLNFARRVGSACLFHPRCKVYVSR